MKRVILSATRAKMYDAIAEGFSNAGCTKISELKQTDSYCQLRLKLPSGKFTIITVWYDYNRVKNGTYKPATYLPWDSSYKVLPDGTVEDSAGTVIGRAVVKQTSDTSVQKYKNEYLIKSIRTDSGDVIIDHPEKANNYHLVVQTLENRKTTRRS